MQVAIESKAVRKVGPTHLKGLRSLKVDHPTVKRRRVVCCEDKPCVTVNDQTLTGKQYETQ
jgi:hypothetical protein